MLADLIPTLAQRALAPEEIGAAVGALFDPGVSDAAKAAFLRAWADRGETAAELAACAEALLPGANDPGVRGSWRGQPLLDCCGTGGGGLPLLNISTGLMFILAALGVPVVKHGNRGLTKKSGSADVLEALGIRIDLAPEQTTRCLEEVGCAFLFAPAYHLSFAAVASVRRQLGAEGRRTIFNLLGPLLNPARPEARLVGVFREEHVMLYEEALREMKCPRFAVVCGEDRETGRKLGEGSADGLTVAAGTIFGPEGRRFDMRCPRNVTGDDLGGLLVQEASESAARLIALLRNEATGLARATLLVNAAWAAWTQGAAASLEEGVAKSEEAVASGRAYEVLEGWRKFSER